jgi:hypothetical protein
MNLGRRRNCASGNRRRHRRVPDRSERRLRLKALPSQRVPTFVARSVQRSRRRRNDGVSQGVASSCTIGGQRWEQRDCHSTTAKVKRTAFARPSGASLCLHVYFQEDAKTPLRSVGRLFASMLADVGIAVGTAHRQHWAGRSWAASPAPPTVRRSAQGEAE